MYENSLKIILGISNAIDHTPNLGLVDPQSTHPFDLLPLEIWLEVLQYVNKPLKLLEINKKFLEIFAPELIPRNIQGAMVFSSLEKVRKTDLFFLKYGPDCYKEDLNGYFYYMREKSSNEYEYEIIDFDVSDWYRAIYSSIVPAHYITKTSSFLKLKLNVLDNEKSIMKRFYKDCNFKLDIVFLDEKASKDFMGLKSSVVQNLTSKKSNKKLFNQFKVTTGEMLCHHYEFDDYRISHRMPYRAAIAEYRHPYGNTFPEISYYYELMPLSRLVYFVKGRKRDSFEYLKSSKELYDLHPLLEEEEIKGLGEMSDLSLFIRDDPAVRKRASNFYMNHNVNAHSTHVTRREFCNKNDILRMINTFAKVSILNPNSSESSMVFFGVNKRELKKVPAVYNSENSMTKMDIVVLNSVGLKTSKEEDI
ncbi:hypothetical protein BN7_4872 [Wickerhamomyces ciferrii]|uniref:Uncharacterized protein n=1 Tax=Wickerhamomyces ciferrii (strain ATCC 14091 / BCRC 22168 / CBS 111 / JCM 3599 / NBRC 0793 / NRRL Y-1031 F-60-10) TaxID=1206466 RepID=K0KJ98_WICCF|nr:uncharacterized protein BN7_4872 [Wickerhamomyces ciferrii]CCH45290.1 hypothetical protein BN7_4872 [Wickerhamomyces ciferrii]